MTKKGGHTQYIGYTWKLCQYSNAYYNAYYINGDIGNSNDEYIRANAPSITTAVHPETEGTMIAWERGGVWGFMCTDDACPYYIDNGVRFFES